MTLRLLPLTSSMLLVGALAGCAAGAHRGDHASGAGMTGDMQAMCEMHKKMMSDPAHQVRMQDHMKSMKPDMRQRMMAMHEKCK